MGRVAISRIVGLPEQFEVLLDAATAESFLALKRLRDEYRAGSDRFDAPGVGTGASPESAA